MDIQKNPRETAFLGILLVVAATVLLAFRSILVKLAYIEDIKVIDLLYVRFLIATPLFFGFAFYKKRSAVWTSIFNGRVAIGCVTAGFFGYYMATLFDFYSLSFIDANVNRVIVYTFPMYVLVLNALIQKAWPKRSEMVTFGLVQLGLFFVLGGLNISLSGVNGLGVGLALASAISYAIYIIINQQIGKLIGSVLFTTYALGCSFIFNTIHFFATSNLDALAQITPRGIGIVVVLSLFCTVLPLLMVSEGIARIGAPRFSLINSSGPAITITLAYILLGETMSFQQSAAAVGIILIIAVAEQRKIKGSK